MKQLGLLLGGAIKNFEQPRRTKQQADAATLERLATLAGMTPQDGARLAMNHATLAKPETAPFIMLPDGPRGSRCPPDRHRTPHSQQNPHLSSSTRFGGGWNAL